MNRALLYKIGAIVFLSLVLIVPFRMVGDLVGERRTLRDGVLQEIGQSATGMQRLDGIALVLPCTDSYEEKVIADSGRTIVRERTRACDVHLLPDRLAIDGVIETDFRRRGIYQALVYRTHLRLDGAFVVPPIPTPPEVRRRWGQPQLVVGIGDVRGILEAPTLEWNGGSVRFQAGTGKAPWMQGIQAPVSVDPMRGESVSMALTLKLAGMERLSIVPAAADLDVRLRSAWPHPSFTGRYLPHTRDVSAQGFEATWRTSDLGTNVGQAFQRCLAGKCDEYAANALAISFIQTVDIYHQAYRAVHYGMMFVLLTFALFFLYEALGGLRVHPVQYALVGVALAIFFVLLIALAEHIGFAQAYAIAACACIGLIVLYVRWVLGTWRRALGMGTLLAGLYGALYLVLGSEDYALLMGALLLFAALAAFMLLTRRLDWYALPAKPREHAAAAEDT